MMNVSSLMFVAWLAKSFLLDTVSSSHQKNLQWSVFTTVDSEQPPLGFDPEPTISLQEVYHFQIRTHVQTQSFCQQCIQSTKIMTRSSLLVNEGQRSIPHMYPHFPSHQFETILGECLAFFASRAIQLLFRYPIHAMCAVKNPSRSCIKNRV